MERKVDDYGMPSVSRTTVKMLNDVHLDFEHIGSSTHAHQLKIKLKGMQREFLPTQECADEYAEGDQRRSWIPCVPHA